MSATQAAKRPFSDSFFSADLAGADPEIARAIELELGRQRQEIELIASENIVSRAVLEAQGSDDDEQVRRRLSRPALLRRLPVRRHRREARDRACLPPVRLPLRQRSGELRLTGKSGRLHGPDAPRRHLHGARSRLRRAPDPWLAGEHVGQMVQRRELQRPARRPAHRHGHARAARPRAQAEGDRRRRLGLFALLGFRPLPRDLRCGRGVLHGRHRAFRRARRRRRPSVSVPACARRDDDDAQDPARTARRHDPDERRGAREEDQLGDLPGPPGRAADARHRREGGRLPGGAAAGFQALRPRRRRERQGARRHGRVRGPRHRCRRHRQPPAARRPASEEAHRQGRRGGAVSRPHHLQQERRAVRSREADGDLRHPARFPGLHDARLRGRRVPPRRRAHRRGARRPRASTARTATARSKPP